MGSMQAYIDYDWLSLIYEVDIETNNIKLKQYTAVKIAWLSICLSYGSHCL